METSLLYLPMGWIQICNRIYIAVLDTNKALHRKLDESENSDRFLEDIIRLLWVRGLVLTIKNKDLVIG